MIDIRYVRQRPLINVDVGLLSVRQHVRKSVRRQLGSPNIQAFDLKAQPAVKQQSTVGQGQEPRTRRQEC